MLKYLHWIYSYVHVVVIVGVSIHVPTKYVKILKKK